MLVVVVPGAAVVVVVEDVVVARTVVVVVVVESGAELQAIVAELQPNKQVFRKDIEQSALR